MGGAATVQIRSYFSSRLLWTAEHLAARAGELERALGSTTHFDIEHHGCVLSSILDAAGFLEAMVNELYKDASDDHGTTGDGYLARLSAETRLQMAELWRETDGSLRPLAKYQLLLTLCGFEPLDRGSQPFQDGQAVIQLRNALAHYKPESLPGDNPHAMEKRLRGKFPDNALMTGTGNAWWPDHCLGRGCAEWACRSAIALADRVSHTIEIRPNYRRLMEDGWQGFGRPPSGGYSSAQSE